VVCFANDTSYQSILKTNVAVIEKTIQKK